MTRDLTSRFALAMALVAALVGAPSGSAAPATNPRLASLQIEIWPEYDRPQALVILKAELASDAALPAAVALRIPASSGGPSAVAYADPSGKLLNLKYEREDAGGFIVLRLTTPERFFHVEFYDPLAPDKPERRYTYAWPGDLAVDQLGVLVKEPAAASNLSVQPSLDIKAVSPDGLEHRAGQLGALKIGQQLAIELPLGWLLALGAGVLVLGTGAALVWRRRRVKPSGRFCPKCGRATAAGDRFCANCGAALR